MQIKTIVSRFIVEFYKAFVAMCMWNWFAVSALNLSPISYLHMLGLILLIDLLTDRTALEKFKLKISITIAEFIVPQAKKDDLSAALKEI